MPYTLSQLLDTNDSSILNVMSKSPGHEGRLPLTEDILRDSSSGDLFGMTQDAALGWNPDDFLQNHVLILGTQGGIRADAGTPIALGYHTGHWEVGLLMRAAAEELESLKRLPFAGCVSDPCDGRTQGTPGMMDSLAYRNDAAVVLKRLIRSLPKCKAVVGVATCDKGLPAMMMALAGQRRLPGIIVPGGATLPSTNAPAENTAKIQAISARFAHGEITLDYAAEMGCRVCGSPGGGCQFLGTAGTSQVVAEAWGLALPHSALAPSGQPIWLDMARRSARAVVVMEEERRTLSDILTEDSLRNAMVVHAACGGSTNLLLHIPAIAFEAGLTRPTVEDWNRVNRQVPRLVDVLPNGPVGHPTIRLFLAGGVPEVMLHLRTLNLLRLDAMTVTGHSIGEILDWWQQSERRARLRELLRVQDGVDPDDVIFSPEKARSRGLTSTVTFPVGNIAPEGSVIKSTAIDPSVVDDDGVFRMTGPAKVFTRERDAIAAIKDGRIQAGDVLVLMCRGPLGAGMEEIFQITGALRYVSFGKHVAVITDARFSGVSTGACIGHVGPEALAGGPIGKLQDGDLIEIVIDRKNLTGSINFVGTKSQRVSAEGGEQILAERDTSAILGPDPDLPDDTRLWALLQQLGGGTWAGCVYDIDAIQQSLGDACRSTA